jgi:hypothetical protein
VLFVASKGIVDPGNADEVCLLGRVGTNRASVAPSIKRTQIDIAMIATLMPVKLSPA